MVRVSQIPNVTHSPLVQNAKKRTVVQGVLDSSAQVLAATLYNVPSHTFYDCDSGNDPELERRPVCLMEERDMATARVISARL